jgi:hypothetical protein
MVNFACIFGSKLFIHAGQGFRGSGQQYHATNGPVEAMNETYKGLSGFVVFGSEVIRNEIEQVNVSGDIALYGQSCRFIYGNKVVVFE